MSEEVSPVQPRPFMPLEEGPKNQRRKTSGGGGSSTKRQDPDEHGENLLRQAEDFQQIINDQQTKRASQLPDLPEKVQVIIKAEDLSPEKLKSLGLDFIEEREEGTLVTISPDAKLETLTDKAQNYISERTPKGNPVNRTVIEPVNKILPSTRSDKLGDRLEEWINQDKLHPDESLWVDIELGGGRSEIGEQNRQEFYEYVSQLNNKLSSDPDQAIAYIGPSLIEDDYSLHRAWLPGIAIEDLLDNSQASWILLIDLIPEIEDEVMRLREVKAAAIPPLPILTEDAPRVVVIDSGIAANHPLFQDGDGQTILGRQVNLLPDSVEPPELTADEVDGGHGTAVASIAAYGDVGKFILDQTPDTYPIFWVENAKILIPASKLDPLGPPDLPKLHPSQLPKKLMRQVVANFHQSSPQLCKIFNLSVGSLPHRLQQPISNWAEELDNLSANNDVLFVLSSGNLHLNEILSLSQEVGDYPRYLLDRRARLRDPAQAHTALTVGSLTYSDVIPAPHRNTDTFFAPAHHPSPFSRSGLLTDGIVKPDVVEIGGNLSHNNLTDRLRQLPELSIPVANRNFISGQQGGLVGFQSGTSMAAPKVANLAGRIHSQYPDASANLIRALIVNSAEWLEHAFLLNFSILGATPDEFKRNMLRLCGYGVPQPDKALSANTHYIVYTTEDEFKWMEDEKTSSDKYPSKVSFFQVNLDQDALFGLPPGTEIRVSITLAYNPPVRKTWRRNYQGIEMRWELIPQNQRVDDFRAQWMAEVEDEESNGEEIDKDNSLKSTPWPWYLRPTLSPRNKNRRGTIIRDWFDVRANELPTPLDIAVLAKVAPWRTPPEPLTQQFALVVSIESRNQTVPIYDEIRIPQRIQIRP